MFRKLAFLAVMVTLVAAAFASAASLPVNGGAIQAGVDSTLYCDVNGVQVLGWGLEVDTNSVTSVRIGDVDAACAGNSMFIKVLDGSGAVLANAKLDGTVVAGSNTFKFTAVDPTKIEGLKIWIEGTTTN